MKTYDQIRVSIVDYGLGNLFSIKHAWNHIGIKAEITSSKDTILNSNLVVLPGVGAFADAMYSLNSLDLSNTIKEVAQSETFIISICLGMQLLMSKSYEFGEHNGLDIIKGQVLPLKNNNDQVKIPQVGWNKITKYNSHGLDWNNSPLKKLPDNSYMYFVHSFYVAPIEKDIILSTTKYGEINFCSSLQSNNIFGFQFNPERSGPNGLQIYQNLAELTFNKYKNRSYI